MNIKNIMEDIVSSAALQVLHKEKELGSSDELLEDICAYVLNRIPPRYVTSERGILHGILDSRFHIQEKTDILFLIHDAIRVIKNRRAEQKSHIAINEEAHTSFFPHIIGEVVEESTFSKIPNVKVTLLYFGEPAQMMGEGWSNPFFTNRGTKSYYHFWPKVVEKDQPKNEYPFTLQFEHESCVSKEFTFIVKPDEVLSTASTKAIPIMLLSLKPGVGSEFLYSE